MGVVIDGPPTSNQISKTQSSFSSALCDVTNAFLCSDEMVDSNLDKTSCNQRSSIARSLLVSTILTNSVLQSLLTDWKSQNMGLLGSMIVMWTLAEKCIKYGMEQCKKVLKHWEEGQTIAKTDDGTHGIRQIGSGDCPADRSHTKRPIAVQLRH